MSIQKDLDELVSMYKYYFGTLVMTPEELAESSKIVGSIENNSINLKENKDKLVKLIQCIILKCDERGIYCCERIKKYLESI